MGPIAILALLAELGAVVQGLEAAIAIAKQAQADGHTNVPGDVLIKIKAAMLQGLPAHSVFEAVRDPDAPVPVWIPASEFGKNADVAPGDGA